MICRSVLCAYYNDGKCTLKTTAIGKDGKCENYKYKYSEYGVKNVYDENCDIDIIRSSYTSNICLSDADNDLANYFKGKTKKT